MDTQTDRRRFLTDVGHGMLIASIGPALVSDLGLCSPVMGGEAPDGLVFGEIEPLVDLMQGTAPDALMPILVERLRGGVPLRRLVAAGALANARAFGGEDYIGFHTIMAMTPSFQMSGELPADHSALPVLKVLYRNAARLQQQGGAAAQTLKPVEPATPPGVPSAEALRDAVRRKDMPEAERLYALLAGESPDDALNNLLPTVSDATEVHRVVLVWRAWSMLDLVGKDRAHTMLRQSVRYCVNAESESYARSQGGFRALLPKLIDGYRLAEPRSAGREADDAWLSAAVAFLFRATPEEAAEGVAAALSEGIAADSIAEAISLSANQLVLRDRGRPEKWSSPGKPAGSVHGDSIGVHACDAVNAWCNIARVANPRNAAAALILAGYEVARDRTATGTDMAAFEPRPYDADTVRVTATDPATLLDEADSAIRNKDQFHACAAVARYGALGYAPRPVFDLMLRFAVSEDGALHAEKYYRTVTEEFARTRPAYRWRHLTALARVTASAYGYPADGVKQSRELLGV